MLRFWLGLSLLSCGLWAAAPQPFWRAKSKIYERVRAGEVIVSVREAGKRALKIAGGGHVAAPREYVFKKAQEFDRLPEMSSFVRSAKYDGQSRILTLQLQAFGYSTLMRALITSNSQSEPRTLSFAVLGGKLKGLQGRFDFITLDPVKTEVGIDGSFNYDSMSLPKFFVEFGMEVAFQRMATGLRSHIESEYKEGTQP